MAEVELRFGNILVKIVDDRVSLVDVNNLAIQTMSVLIPVGEQLAEKQLKQEHECVADADDALDEEETELLKKLKDKEVQMFA